jgi:acetyl-CoA C-acetyltransferase
VSVNNHKNGAKNPFAQFRNEISIEDVLNSTMIADPLGTLDCSPITDGAAAVVLVSERIAKKHPNPIWIRASSQASDIMALHDRPSMTSIRSVKEAGAQALEKARIGLREVGLLEVHDCFSINEILCLEGLGFAREGEGGKLAESGGISLAGEIPTNTQGGLKSIGHPVGATGIRQVADVCRVLRGDSWNKVSGADVGMTCNVGGIGGTAVVHVLGREM